MLLRRGDIVYLIRTTVFHIYSSTSLEHRLLLQWTNELQCCHSGALREGNSTVLTVSLNQFPSSVFSLEKLQLCSLNFGKRNLQVSTAIENGTVFEMGLHAQSNAQ